jgi:hypothetical protein
MPEVHERLTLGHSPGRYWRPTKANPARRRYVVVELKTTPFKPEYAVQLNFYLSAIDTQVKAKEDQPAIGLLLCNEKNRLAAEHALRG